MSCFTIFQFRSTVPWAWSSHGLPEKSTYCVPNDLHSRLSSCAELCSHLCSRQLSGFIKRPGSICGPLRGDHIRRASLPSAEPPPRLPQSLTEGNQPSFRVHPDNTGNKGSPETIPKSTVFFQKLTVSLGLQSTKFCALTLT